MKISARNTIKGKIVEIKEGMVNSEVILDVNGIKLVSVITKDSAEALGLKVGKEAYAIIKASNVMIAID